MSVIDVIERIDTVGGIDTTETVRVPAIARRRVRTLRVALA